MFGTLKAAIAAATLLGVSTLSAQALTKNVDFRFLDDQGQSVAFGTFGYDDSLSGTIGFGDVDTFFLAIDGTVYDTAWVTQTADSGDIFGMSYNTGSQSFETLTYSDGSASYPYILAALNADASATYGFEGFFVRPEDNTPALMSYPRSYIYYSTLDITIRAARTWTTGTPDLALISSVPLPGAVWLMSAGLVALGAAKRMRTLRAA
ncbi:MAG: VPLPA-CTERM sorting domain-containing protein [Pseudomonadota bacterium]